MDVLLVAPLEAGALPNAMMEIGEISNALRPQMLSGRVTAADIGHAMRRPYDLVWFVTHGGPDGLLLSNGEIISVDRLVQYLRRHRPAVFLNTCDGDQLALEINNATQAPVIYSRAPLDDEEAMVTGTLLAQALATGESLTGAYHLSRPEDSQNYRMIGADSNSGNKHGSPRIVKMIEDLAVQIEMQIDDVERRMNDRLDGIERDMSERFDRLESEPISLGPREALNWTAAYVVFVSTFPLLFYDIRRMIDLSWQGALIIVLLMIVLAYGLFARGLGFRWLNKDL